MNDIKPENCYQVNSSNKDYLFVNRDNLLPKGYKPKDMVFLDKKKIQLAKKSQLLKITTDALYNMTDSAKKDNIKGFIVNSAYRTEKEQQQVFDDWLAVYKKKTKTYKAAYELTRLRVALPGRSEHQTGLSLDILSKNGKYSSTFYGTKEQKWLEKNCYKYGFIIRYPKDKTKQTFSMYEPWHIRYVGKTLSGFLVRENYCLEEFYQKMFEKKMIDSGSILFILLDEDAKVYLSRELKIKADLGYVSKGKNMLCINY
jgi:D-alanyl-D-alanine carboxypeptidase